jgi:hypothetical protein
MSIGPMRAQRNLDAQQTNAVDCPPQTSILLDQLCVLQAELLEAEKRLDAIGDHLLGSRPELERAASGEAPPPNGVMNAALIKVQDLRKIADRIQALSYRLEQV